MDMTETSPQLVDHRVRAIEGGMHPTRREALESVRILLEGDRAGIPQFMPELKDLDQETLTTRITSVSHTVEWTTERGSSGYVATAIAIFETWQA